MTSKSNNQFFEASLNEEWTEEDKKRSMHWPILAVCLGLHESFASQDQEIIIMPQEWSNFTVEISGYDR